MRRFRPHVPRYVRARLHRRIFAWFGATILSTGIVVAGVMFFVGGTDSGRNWHEQFERAERFAGDRFARVWDRPDEREELGRAIAETLDVGVAIEDARGGSLGTFGRRCERHALDVPVMRAGERLGRVVFCIERQHGASWRLLLPLLVAGAMLWGASGKIARRLARPLGDVARVAQEIGRGRLESRARLACRAPDEVGALAEAINDMASRIERQLHDQRVLLAAVSHELRTPLGHLRILIELIRQNGAGEKTIDDLEREVVEIDTLVGELLASSRLDFTAIAPRPLVASDLARRALERAGASAEKLALDGAAGEADLALEGDPTLLGRALANLIDNAEKHGGGLVALRVRAAGERVTFEADDAGGGIPDGEEERVFEPFFRGSASEGGTLGLGLSLVKRIAQAHGGTAFAARRVEGGARVGFHVRRRGPPSAES